MTDVVAGLVDREYAFGFHTPVDTEMVPTGLSEDVIRLQRMSEAARLQLGLF
jgi:hypothetical protein